MNNERHPTCCKAATDIEPGYSIGEDIQLAWYQEDYEGDEGDCPCCIPEPEWEVVTSCPACGTPLPELTQADLEAYKEAQRLRAEEAQKRNKSGARISHQLSASWKTA